MQRRLFVAADWSQLESWLTAIHAQDDVMYGELVAQLAGGPKIHALNASLMYGIEPADAKTYMVNLQGQERPAYDAGKRISHAWNYGAKARKIAQTFWLAERFAREVEEKLADKYKATAQWRTDLTNEIFGVARYVCGRCRQVSAAGGWCQNCMPRTVRMVWDGWESRPTRELRTVFERRRLYPGKRTESANAAASQKPQSCGASMWWRKLQNLNGMHVVNGKDVGWPVPPGIRPERRGQAPRRDEYAIYTGTYDSFVVDTPPTHETAVVEWLPWSLEVPWPQLGGQRFPCELLVGYNYGAYHEQRNPNGLKEIPYKALTYDKCPCL